MRGANIFVLATAALVIGSSAEAQVWRQEARTRQDVARAQGVPPGQLPPPNECRVWYDNRPNGRQPSPTNCRQAEAMASRDRNARVIYGENAYYGNRNGYGINDEYRGYPGARDNERAVPRGTVRDPRARGGVEYGRDDRYYTNSPAYQNGYRDGVTKGREDAEDRDRFDVDRHSWYRAADRGYESRYGNRRQYEAAYRQAFEAGYSEGYRIYARR